jgi:hypothetical protein
MQTNENNGNAAADGLRAIEKGLGGDEEALGRGGVRGRA